MRIMVINGECIQVNTSSNLCNLAYLKGLVEAGHDITLLSADSKGYTTDPNMIIPGGVKNYTYPSMTLYERLSKIKKKKSVVLPLKEISLNATPLTKRGRLFRVKRFFFSLYGVHGIYLKFARKAFRFRTDKPFDLVLSLCTPASSHVLAYKLIKHGHIKTSHWVQVWEDPWYSEVGGFTHSAKVFCEEKRLLSLAEKICYVSPITLENQKKLYPESAEKMFWVPLPAYFDIEPDSFGTESSVFGYFGEYSRPTRDLEPFYLAAKKSGIEVNICGNSNLGLEATDRIHIFPRLNLADLKPLEDQTGVLVFLCNSRGGQIPGKIYQYAATNKTVLFILDGTDDEKRILREFFEPFNRFVFCENKQEDIERAILRIQCGELDGVDNKPLTQFKPVDIVKQIIDEAMQ